MIEKGYLVYANNNADCNYVRQAYALALSLRIFNHDAHITLVSKDPIPSEYLKVFDDVLVPKKTVTTSKLNAEQRQHQFNISPYLKTMVFDADVLITENLDAWWKYLSNQMIYYTSEVYSYKGDKITDNTYRQTFIENNLPLLYNTMNYFEKSEEAADFFRVQQYVVENWEHFYKKVSPKKQQKWVSMDVSSAITSKLFANQEKITAKDTFMKIVHMKPKLQGWRHDYVRSSGAVTMHFSKNNFYVGNFKQNGIIHYVEDVFLTDRIIRGLEESYETVRTV